MITKAQLIPFSSSVFIWRGDQKFSVPNDPANTDYINFKKDIAEETAELQDADGNTMTAAEAKAFVATLP